MLKLIAKTLEQKGRNSDLDRRFHINAQNFLDIQLGLKSQDFRYPINIRFLDARPTPLTVVPWKWVFTSVMLAGLTCLFAYIYLASIFTLPMPPQLGQFDSMISQWKIEAFALSSILMLICILASIRKTQHYILLKTRYGQVPVVRFLRDTPSRTAVEEFIREIRFRIESFMNKNQHNEMELLSAELEGLRNLRDKSVIKEKEYAKAKQTLLKKHAALQNDPSNKPGKNKLEIAQHS